MKRGPEWWVVLLVVFGVGEVVIHPIILVPLILLALPLSIVALGGVGLVGAVRWLWHGGAVAKHEHESFDHATYWRERRGLPWR